MGELLQKVKAASIVAGVALLVVACGEKKEAAAEAPAATEAAPATDMAAAPAADAAAAPATDAMAAPAADAAAAPAADAAAAPAAPAEAPAAK
ncbi:hypothetical protein [Sandaracinobacteroides saxicola]|uniref:Lipoprotein n=1 Tax=Sandaracinobacteroides saxicola TaxID=2759707 RepID=A0A7G5IG01_9SPHN|nr:hypothetical protein [Sandaracinobacteroides saxicola]QMW22293.1 hypothetical protein H3309_13150 [Sandaracinobacteroides saxicola]